MMLQMVRNECVRFCGHVDIEINYKILRLIPKVLKAIFQVFLKFGQAIADAMFFQKISNFW